MKKSIISYLKNSDEGVSLKKLRKKVVKEHLIQNNNKDKKETKSHYDEALLKLKSKNKVIVQNDIVRLCSTLNKTVKKEVKDVKDKNVMMKKRKLDDIDQTLENDNKVYDEVPKKKKKMHDRVDDSSTNVTAASNPAVDIIEPRDTDTPNTSEKTKKERSELVSFDLSVIPKSDINPRTGKKMKKRSKEAHERRRARYLLVKNLDSRNKCAQDQFAANQKWLNSASNSSTTPVPVSATASCDITLTTLE